MRLILCPSQISNVIKAKRFDVACMRKKGSDEINCKKYINCCTALFISIYTVCTLHHGYLLKFHSNISAPYHAEYDSIIYKKLSKRRNNMLIKNDTTPMIFYIGFLANDHLVYFSFFRAALRGIGYTQNNSIGYLC